MTTGQRAAPAALREIRGAGPLTPSERISLQLIALGATTAEVGEILGVKDTTIRGYCSQIRDKMAVHTTTRAVVIALSNGWIAPTLPGE